ncbi:hypothetical protein AXX12_00135 [Anaerosporomusa subterranea]|uniref:AsmA-like C-terminal domain-containing protein n=1 Tax=Anaerosporomusa subterranea TaxID=1794912 RepID=A0A154BW26_ANASB|nr:DUF748 domain-containing protein [Anaerosporomusa subterranea]KYZ77990.1 hypothetical protein AXX12_00135 [Anaerosporomusa subterranea]
MKEWLVKYKKNIIIALIPLIVLGGLWQVVSGKVAKALQDSLVASVGQKLNGRLQVGSIDLSLLSWVRIRNVAVYDKQDNLVAKSPNIEIKYKFSDLTKGNLGMSSIEVVAIQGAEIWLKTEKERWNWEGLVKDDKTATDFRGKVEVGEGTVHIGNNQITQTIEGVNGTLDFITYPAGLGIDLKGRVSQATLGIVGNWGESNASELTLRTDGFDVAKLSGLLPATQEIRLEKGLLKKLQVVAKRDDKSIVHYQAEGEFSALTVAGKVNIRDGQGKFSADENGLHFRDLALMISGQRTEGKGSILLKDNKQSLDFALTLPDVDPAAFFTGLAVQRPLFVTVNITGPLIKPLISGSFKIPQVTISDMSVSEISGNMRYDEGRLSLQQVHGAAYQGQLSVAGEVLTANESYELAASGSGMNSSALTDKDVQGPLDFTGHVSGKGETAVTQGDFVIRNGKAYGVSFQTLTGSFIKRGGTTEISNITIHTALGTFYPEQLSRDALEKLSQHNIPTSKEDVKKAVTDALVKKIFR